MQESEQCQKGTVHPQKILIIIIFKQRQSLYLNKYIETKICLSIIKMEMKRRGLKKKAEKN